jgi:predicted adenylyl cyclase CyaB
MIPADLPNRRNIELKARYDDLSRARRLCQGIDARDAGLLVQTDTYFNVAKGRLKLREIEPKEAQLIWYSRSNHAQSRASEYVIVPVSDPTALKHILSLSLGVLTQIHKQRELLLWQNVRIHLDQVDGLGTFVEFEAVLSPIDDEASGHARIAELRKSLLIQEEDLIQGSYSDLKG